MPKTKISEFSSTPANNTDIDSINIAEGCAPSGINDAIRELMAQLKDFQVGSAGDPVTVGGVLTVQAGSASTPALTTAGDTNTGMFFPAADTIAFAEGGAEVARFDSGGNLGLGVTPSAWGGAYKALQLSTKTSLSQNASDLLLTANAYNNGANWLYLTSSFATTYVQSSTGQHQWYNTASGTAGGTVTFTQAMTLSAAGGLSVGTTTDAGAGNIWASNRVYAGDGSAANNSFARAAGTGTGMYFPAADTLGLSTSGAERARIDSSGNLLVGGTGTTTTSGGIQIGLNSSYPEIRIVTNGTTSRYGMEFCNTVNGAVGNITINSTSTSYNTSSDQRLKENIQDADSASSLIDALQVRKFDWKSDNSHQRYGFVAQELVTVAPEAVYQPEDADQMMAVDYSKLVPMLVKEIQSLRKRLADAGIA